MKVVLTEGCVVNGITVDGKDFNDYEISERKEILHKIIDSLDNSYLQNILYSACQYAGTYKYKYHCEECGDDVRTYTLKIE